MERPPEDVAERIYALLAEFRWPQGAVLTSGTATPVQDPHVDEKVWTPDDDKDFGGWFCIATKPYPCPADCGFIAHHATAGHKILVWPEKDDPELLELAGVMMEKGRDPRVVEYAPELGPAISYYAWVAFGRLAHYRPS